MTDIQARIAAIQLAHVPNTIDDLFDNGDICGCGWDGDCWGVHIAEVLVRELGLTRATTGGGMWEPSMARWVTAGERQ